MRTSIERWLREPIIPGVPNTAVFLPPWLVHLIKSFDHRGCRACVLHRFQFQRFNSYVVRLISSGIN